MPIVRKSLCRFTAHALTYAVAGAQADLSSSRSDTGSDTVYDYEDLTTLLDANVGVIPI